MKKKDFITSAFDTKQKDSLPLFLSPVQAGFPSPADDYIEESLDLNKYLISHPSATFFVRVQGNSMIDAGIHNQDILIVDRALNPTNGKIAIAVINGEFTVKRIRIKKNKKIFLEPQNPSYSLIEISPDDDFQIWGIVTYVIHKAF